MRQGRACQRATRRSGATDWRVGGLLFGLALAAGPLAAGTIRYEADANRIVVAGFPEEQPATLDDVRASDRAGGWGRIRFEPSTDTVTLEASLWIGAANDLGTFFQIGRPGHPRETLVLRGDLVVTPPRPSPQRRDGRLEVSNRLTLGDPAHPDIRPAVKMDCAAPGEHAVRVLAGTNAWPTRRGPVLPLGELFMFHATLTAATPAPNRAYAASIRLSHAGANFQMADSAVSWWTGDLFSVLYVPYETWTDSRTMRGMTFEQGGRVGWLAFEDCAFRGLDTALTHGGATRCVFENNRRNLALEAHNHVGAVLLDCVVGAPALPLRLARTRRDLAGLRAYSATRHARDLAVLSNPGVLECSSVPVQVVDARGRPVPRAAVRIECPAEPDGAALLRDLAVTDRSGLTPPPGHRQALVLVKREWRPTDRPEAPELKTYHYRLTIEAPGCPPAALPLDGAADWPSPLVVTLTP